MALPKYAKCIFLLKKLSIAFHGVTTIDLSQRPYTKVTVSRFFTPIYLTPYHFTLIYSPLYHLTPLSFHPDFNLLFILTY